MSTETAAPPQPIKPSDVPWTEWSDVPRFAVRYRHLSQAALGKDYHVGVAIEELAPGMQSAPAHYHIFEEEHLYILEGSLTLCLGAGRHAMTAGDYVCFPAGQKAGHCLVNDSGAPCRYLVIGENNPNEVVVYTDSNKVLVRALGRRALFDLAALRGYWDGEETGLPPGATPPDEAAHAALEAPARLFPPIAAGDVEMNQWDLAPGFVDRNRHLTHAALGAAVGEDYRVGVLIESPPPGARCAPRHYHMLEEEHALVLEGEVTLLLGEESHTMKPGDYVCFPAGLEVGHSFLNSGSGPCSYLMIGAHDPNDVCVMPDSNKMQVRALNSERSIFDMSAVRNYLDGETAG